RGGGRQRPDARPERLSDQSHEAAGNQQAPGLEVSRADERPQKGGSEHPPDCPPSEERSGDPRDEEGAYAELGNRESRALPERRVRQQRGRRQGDANRAPWTDLRGKGHMGSKLALSWDDRSQGH